MRERPPGCKTVFVGGCRRTPRRKSSGRCSTRYRMRIGSSTEKKDSGGSTWTLLRRGTICMSGECQQRSWPESSDPPIRPRGQTPPPLSSSHIEQITGVFTAATRQKAWDHFSKAQRKNIDIWHKQCEVGIKLWRRFDVQTDDITHKTSPALPGKHEALLWKQR
ncbi:hypothetical protein F7725_002617 [Dissostichus mawsoni]|uniref:Uncharacterized protein n=1 Tax=Dissostichus mawsoni TaxID=36200 RepID=A0A7J5Y611_DISMA|nr:hypothetical protein F7725_002617 [Dissostichus mawsoni]